VPLYEISVRAVRKNRHAADFNPGEMLEVISAQAAEGVDFFTIHAGVTRKAVGLLKRRRRIMDVVSRGGAVVCAWMRRRKQENPFYEHFDQILDICRAYDVTLSLGDGLRPGSIFDATDAAQIEELRTLGALALRCRKKGVQAIIEGPGHVPINQIRENVLLEKRLCRGAPFYILGPLVTDIAAGYDHINAAIGGALAASYGADFLCYVTASEHLRQPPAEDVKEGVVASRIAAHAADIAKGLKPARDWDRQMSLARRKRDWQKQIELSVNPEKAARYRASSLPRQKDVCTMCGEFCSSKMMDEVMRA
jgi:phosphomethylpyrimidine synthase